MKQEDRQLVSSVIEKNTRRVTVEELAAKGNRHVRVVSSERVLQLIEAVVDQTIAQRAGEMAQADRDKIVREAEARFKKATQLQADREALLKQQQDLIRRQEEEITRHRAHGKELVGALRRRESRLANLRETLQSYDAEIERLANRVELDASLVARLESAVAARDERVEQLQELMRGLEGEIAEARARTAGDGEIQALKGELAEMKDFLKSSLAAPRAGAELDPETLEAMIARLAEREEKKNEQLEGRFRASLDETLDKISKTLHTATARPFDRPIEATDVLVSKVFDDEERMDSNLDTLDVHVSTTRDGIASSLERLRRMRNEALADDDEDDAPDQANA